ncbi:MAG: FHA domain-containing protein [Polyangia bacterium]
MKSPSLRFRIRAGSGPAAAASVERVAEIEPRDAELVIGRRRGSDIELPFASVSEQHARLSRGEKSWLVADLESANGTLLNGRRLTPFVPQALSVGDVLRLASVDLVFEGEGALDQGTGGQGAQFESTATLARRLVSDLFGTSRPAEVARVVVRDGPAQGRELRLEAAGRRYLVGRGTGCNLVVPDDDISREHAEFARRWDGVFVRDLDSKNGVVLRGERLAGERRLSDGDVLRLGQTTFRLDDPEDRYLRQLQEVEARAGQAAKAGADADSSRDGRAGEPALVDTRTSNQLVRPSPVARPEPGPVGHRKRSAWHGPGALMVIAALVLAAAIALALSFILGT